MIFNLTTFPALAGAMGQTKINFIKINTIDVVQLQQNTNLCSSVSILQRKFISGAIARLVNKNVYFASSNFVSAMMKALDSFSRINFLEFAKENIKSNGCLVLNGEQVYTYYYFREGDDLNLVCFIGECLFADILVNLGKLSEEEKQNEIKIDESIKNATPAKVEVRFCSYFFGTNDKDKGSLIYMLVSQFILFFIFEKYAQIRVERESLKANRKIHSSILSDDVINKLPINIEIRDSSWFTTICRDEDFKVRGHFRLQPKNDKDGNPTKELIWIEDYMKHGYHRNAKITNKDYGN